LISPILITLGSNIEPEKHLRLALQKLAEYVTVRAVSRVYESPAINAAGEVNLNQGAFLNAAAWIETELLPQDLKFDVLRRIESEMGRVRTADKFAARVIDLDLALYGSLVQTDPVRLPDIPRRAFVILPLADLAPEATDPLTGETLAAIAAPFRDTIRLRGDVSLGV
jgi:2-amino-4-hydroxy-6-hydroxymethyldihydropteridine diphosphokinase